MSIKQLVFTIAYLFTTSHPANAGWPFLCARQSVVSDGTWTYTWQNGRQLASMTNGTTTASFVYNADGLRVQKTVNGVVTKYTLHGKNVSHMTSGNDDLHFFYDAANKPAVVVYNGTAYAYVKNLQGDIVAILDSSKNVVVNYVYDAWGRPISCSGTMADTLGVINPFRYRSYVYDQETGLYYLRSRYYNSGWCRFVNADAILSLGRQLLGFNSYSYCSNSPVCCDDQDGFKETEMNEQIAAFFAAIEKRGAGKVSYDQFGNGELIYDKRNMLVTSSQIDEIVEKGAMSVYNFGLGAAATAVTSNPIVGGAISTFIYIIGEAAEYHVNTTLPSIPNGNYTYETVMYKEVSSYWFGDIVYKKTYHYVWGQDETDCEFFPFGLILLLMGPALMSIAHVF